MIFAIIGNALAVISVIALCIAFYIDNDILSTIALVCLVLALICVILGAIDVYTLDVKSVDRLTAEIEGLKYSNGDWTVMFQVDGVQGECIITTAQYMELRELKAGDEIYIIRTQLVSGITKWLRVRYELAN